MFTTNPIPFLCIFLIRFIGTSLCAPSYQWDSTGTVRNVQTFAKFIDKLYAEYSKSDRIDSIFSNSLENYTNKQKRTVFNFTFAKCSAEIAHLRVINRDGETDNGRPFRNFNVVPPEYDDSVPFLLYDQSLGHQIVNAFEKEIFAPAKEQKIAKTVENQIMQLAFSFAVRVLLCVIHLHYYYRIATGDWQLHTLLSAFKILSAKNDANIGNGIFPFQIIQIDTEGNHWWKQKLSIEGDKTEKSAQKEQKEQQMHYIDNFNFILRLSAFELTQYEIVKVLDQIMNKQKGKTDGTTIYTFIMDHFRTSLSNGGILNKINMGNRLDCAMVNFGRELNERFHGFYEDFFNCYNFWKKSEKCGGNVHQDEIVPLIQKHKNIQLLFIADNNTPIRGSNQIAMDIFHEPLWNYVRVIKVDSNENKGTKQFCDELRSVVAVALAEKDKNQIQNFTQTKEFKSLLNALSYEADNYMYSAMKVWSDNYDGKNLLNEKIVALKELQKIMDQILEEYKRTNALQLNGKMHLKTLRYLNQISGLIFYEILQKYNGEDNVRYDEQRQLLTFPIKTWEHFIRRLGTFVKKNLTTSDNIIDEIDFVSAMDAIASSRDNLESEKRMKIFGLRASENKKFFEWLFTLALRVCLQMEGKNDFAEKYAPILYAHVARFILYSNFRYEYKINVEQNLVRINLPNWKMPYLVYLEDENELKEQRAKKIFQFLFSLFIYSPTIFDVVKMAKILHEMNEENGHISIEQSSDPELFLFILQNVTANSEDLDGMNKQMSEKLKIEGESSAGKTELSVANSFCFLSHFVVQLLEKAIDEAKYLLNIEFLKVFIGQNKTFCTEEQIREETMEIFGANVMDISKKTIKIDFNLRADIQQKILPDLIGELETMINNEDWNCTNLKHLKEVEWVLLKNGLMGNGQSNEWKEIKKLMDNWTTEFNGAFSEGKRVNFQKTVEKLKAKLENLKEGK